MRGAGLISSASSLATPTVAAQGRNHHTALRTRAEVCFDRRDAGPPGMPLRRIRPFHRPSVEWFTGVGVSNPGPKTRSYP